MIAGVKARWTTQCERCKADITVGASYVVLHGRRWHSHCATHYLSSRHLVHGKQ